MSVLFASFAYELVLLKFGQGGGESLNSGSKQSCLFNVLNI